MVGRLVEQHDVGLGHQRRAPAPPGAPRRPTARPARDRRRASISVEQRGHAIVGRPVRIRPGRRRRSAATLAWPVKSGSCGRVAIVVPGWAKRVPPSVIGSPARMRSRVDLPAPLRPTSDSRSPGAIGEIDAVEDGLVAEVKADAGEGQEGRLGHVF